MTWFVGVDPGKSGAIAVIDSSRQYVDSIKLRETPHDVSDWLRELLELPDRPQTMAALERVGSRPGQGVASTFKFGWSAGFVEGLLVAHRETFSHETPSRWKKDHSCRTRGD